MDNRPIVWLQNVLTPYRRAFFEAAVTLLPDLKVWTCSSSQYQDFRPEFMPPSDLSWSHYLGAKHLRFGGGDQLIVPFLSAAVLRTQPRLFIVTGFDILSAYPAIWVARRLGAKIGVWTETWDEGVARDGFAEHRIKRWLLNIAAVILVPGRMALESVIRDFAVDKAKVMAIGYPCEPVLLPAIAKIPAAKPRVRLIYVGRLVEAKGIRTLLTATQRIVSSGHPVELTLVGDGPLAQEASSLPFVRWTGWLEGDSLEAEYRSADVFVSLTHNDTWGMTITEAVARGLPVVVSNKAAAAMDLVEDNVSGFIVNPHDVPVIESALIRLVRDQHLRQRFRTAALLKAPYCQPQQSAQRLRSAIERVDSRHLGGERS